LWRASGTVCAVAGIVVLLGPYWCSRLHICAHKEKAADRQAARVGGHP
jgi:hypothetical protein